ncbi:MAG: hypothetical protein IJ594_03940 [Oscillospiraceae bacterium]|nr:hypothetical protein [Oscillospiraceae bacterium]
MDIWTQQLQRRHLPLLTRWLGRDGGALTPHDLPREADGLARWFEACAAEPGRFDCLALVYETPVGLAGLRRGDAPADEAELYLLLCEVGYNPLRTATYVTLRMLDRAFLERGLARVTVRVSARHARFLEALERMGFSRTEDRGDTVCLAVDKAAFLARKYLF